MANFPWPVVAFAGFATATTAALVLYTNPGIPLFTRTTSNEGIYILDPVSTQTIDDAGAFAFADAAPGAAGRILRQANMGSTRWQNQATWCIDPSAGNDENVGDVSPNCLKTTRELAFRWGGCISVAMTVTLLGTPDSLGQLNVQWCGGAPPSSALLKFVGTPTTRVTGTFAAGAAVPVPASNLASQAVDNAARVWTSEVGYVLAPTSGAATSSWAFVAKDLGAQVARLGQWDTGGAGGSAPASTSTVPANGDTYKTVSFTQITSASLPTLQAPSTGGSAGLEFDDVEFTVALRPNPVAGFRYAFYRVRFDAGLNAAGALLDLRGDYFAAAQTWSGSSADIFADTITVAGNLTLQQSASLNGFNTLVQGGTLTVTDSAFGALASFGIFDATGNGLLVQNNGYAVASTALYGSGATVVGCSVTQGGSLRIAGGITPTLTSGGTELKIEGATTAIPAFTAGAAVPAASTANSWSTWAGAPFSGYAHSLKNSCIFRG